jgi:hypothetical protein
VARTAAHRARSSLSRIGFMRTRRVRRRSLRPYGGTAMRRRSPPSPPLDRRHPCRITGSGAIVVGCAGTLEQYTDLQRYRKCCVASRCCSASSMGTSGYVLSLGSLVSARGCSTRASRQSRSRTLTALRTNATGTTLHDQPGLPGPAKGSSTEPSVHGSRSSHPRLFRSVPKSQGEPARNSASPGAKGAPSLAPTARTLLARYLWPSAELGSRAESAIHSRKRPANRKPHRLDLFRPTAELRRSFAGSGGIPRWAAFVDPERG